MEANTTPPSKAYDTSTEFLVLFGLYLFILDTQENLHQEKKKKCEITRKNNRREVADALTVCQARKRSKNLYVHNSHSDFLSSF